MEEELRRIADALERIATTLEQESSSQENSCEKEIIKIKDCLRILGANI